MHLFRPCTRRTHCSKKLLRGVPHFHRQLPLCFSEDNNTVKICVEAVKFNFDC
jgi:hypothetical protein